MAPRKIKNLSLPERLRIEIEKVAEAQERPVNDVLAEAVDCYVKDKQWASLKRYGREKAKRQASVRKMSTALLANPETRWAGSAARHRGFQHLHFCFAL